MNKRGLSTAVSTVIIIAIVLVVVSIIGFTVMSLVNEGTGRFSLREFTVDASIEKVTVNYTTGLATIKIKRQAGEGELVGFKIIYEDSRTAEVFEERFSNFQELGMRTFNFNLSYEGSALLLAGVEKVSIAPIIVLESGEEVIGRVIDSVEGLGNLVGDIERKEPDPDICYADSECGTDYFIEDSEYCDVAGIAIYIYKRIFTCTLGFCYDEIVSVFNTTCGEQCYDGLCIEELIACSPENVTTVCGVDGLVGFATCSLDGTSVVQDYKDYECIDGNCSLDLLPQVLEVCNETEVCFQGECFVPLECALNSDCVSCEICEEGLCVAETSMNNGVIRSVWPYGIGEYFDSFDLPSLPGSELIGKYINFPGSLQTGCLTLRDHVVPPENTTGLIAYVRLNESETSIADNENYEIWETTCMC